METMTLPLYPTVESKPEINSSKTSFVPNPQEELGNILNSILPQQSEETKITRTRKALGKTAEAFSDEQIETIVTEFQFLIDTWLDEFEKDVFNGMTLKEVLNEK